MLVSSGDICNINHKVWLHYVLSLVSTHTLLTIKIKVIDGAEELSILIYDADALLSKWFNKFVRTWLCEVVPRGLNDFLVVERGLAYVNRRFST